MMIIKHFDSVILKEEVVSTDIALDIERKRYEQEEASRKEDLESADFIEISDCSDIDIDENDYNASIYRTDFQIYARPNTLAEGFTVPNTPISNSTNNIVFAIIPDRQSQSSESGILNSLAINALRKYPLQHMHTSN